MNNHYRLRNKQICMCKNKMERGAEIVRDHSLISMKFKINKNIRKTKESKK